MNEEKIAQEFRRALRTEFGKSLSEEILGRMRDSELSFGEIKHDLIHAGRFVNVEGLWGRAALTCPHLKIRRKNMNVFELEDRRKALWKEFDREVVEILWEETKDKDETAQLQFSNEVEDLRKQYSQLEDILLNEFYES